MPELPTLTVTAAQANRMLDAFGSAELYKEWLKNQIINYVTQYEIDSGRQAIIEDVKTDLGAAPEEDRPV